MGVFVHLVGTIQPGKTIEAPLTGRACIHYELESQADSHDPSKPGPRFRLAARLARDARTVALASDDGTGVALIDPRGARVALPVSERQMTTGDPTERQRALLVQHGMRGRSNLFREGALVVGTRVVICGMAVRDPDPDGAARATGYRGDSPTRLRLAGSAKQPLLIPEEA